jgi:hypothetical protein
MSWSVNHDLAILYPAAFVCRILSLAGFSDHSKSRLRRLVDIDIADSDRQYRDDLDIRVHALADSEREY